MGNWILITRSLTVSLSKKPSGLLRVSLDDLQAFTVEGRFAEVARRMNVGQYERWDGYYARVEFDLRLGYPVSIYTRRKPIHLLCFDCSNLQTIDRLTILKSSK